MLRRLRWQLITRAGRRRLCGRFNGLWLDVVLLLFFDDFGAEVATHAGIVILVLLVVKFIVMFA